MYDVINDYVEEIVMNTYIYEELQATIKSQREKVVFI